MAGGFFNKILDIIGMGDDAEDTNEKEEVDTVENGQIEVLSNYKKGKVVSIHHSNSNSNIKVVVVQPGEYDEITDLCDCLKNRKIAIVNLQKLDPKTAQRFIDSAGGAAYALECETQEVTPGVFLITPNNVEVTSDLKDELNNRGLFSWTGK